MGFIRFISKSLGGSGIQGRQRLARMSRGGGGGGGTRSLKVGHHFENLLPTGSEQRGVLGVGSIPVAILPSCQDMKTIAL